MISVLFIDDEPAILDVTKLTLEKTGGLAITTVESVTDAITLLNSRNFDVIITDFQMADMDGIEFLKYVKSKGIESSFIIFTGRGREHVAIEALNLGADFYLQKGADTKVMYTELRNMIVQSVHRKRAESALMESEERYRTLAESSDDFIFIIGRDDTVLYVNSHAASQFRMKPEELFGKPRTELFPLTAGGSQKEHLQQVFDSGKPLMVESTITFPGSQYRWLNTHLIPLKSETGDVVSVMGISRDITRQKEIEAGLKESEGRYRAVVDTQEEFICRFKPDGTHIFVNPAYCAYFGMPCTTITGSQFKPDIPEEDWPNVRRHFNSLSPENPAASVLHRVVMPDGEVRWHSWSDRAIFDKDGNVTEYQSVGRDITEIMRAEEAVNLANKKLNLLNSITRHDILNQITVLNGLLELAEEESADPSQGEHIRKIRKIARTIESQIAFTKEYQDIGLIAASWQDLRTTLDRVATAFDLSGISLENEMDPFTIYADPLLEKVFHNLIDNSLKHGQDVTRITVSTKKTRYGLIVFYEDDGIGIPHENKERIFDSGFGKNSGFGLYLAREILDITGLSLIETGEPGKGAKFEIFAPRGKYRKG